MDELELFADDEWVIFKDDETRLVMYKGIPKYGPGYVIENPYIRINKQKRTVSMDCTLSKEQIMALAKYINKEDLINETDE